MPLLNENTASDFSFTIPGDNFSISMLDGESVVSSSFDVSIFNGVPFMSELTNGVINANTSSQVEGFALGFGVQTGKSSVKSYELTKTNGVCNSSCMCCH